MDIGIISARYARALFDFAKEEDMESRVYDDIKMLASSFETEPALKKALNNPVLSVSEKAQLLQNAAGIEISTVFERFIRLILRHRRENLLQIMCLIYIDLYRKEKNINRVYLYSAVPLSDETKDRLAYAIRQKTGGTIELSEHIKPDIIGGLVMRMNNYQIDASIASQLKHIKKQLMENNRQIVKQQYDR